MSFSSDGYYLASASQDNTVALWEVFSGNKIYTFIDPQLQVNVVKFSPNGKILASGSNDKNIYVWQINEKLFVDYYFSDELEDKVSTLNFSAEKIRTKVNRILKKERKRNQKKLKK
ncbi:MAG: hypothetical protein HC906_03085 [Bacteroidales bacterium]|nr:hypothetical protein [Bacteroidales bacterium]